MTINTTMTYRFFFFITLFIGSHSINAFDFKGLLGQVSFDMDQITNMIQPPKHTWHRLDKKNWKGCSFSCQPNEKVLIILPGMFEEPSNLTFLARFCSELKQAQNSSLPCYDSIWCYHYHSSHSIEMSAKNLQSEIEKSALQAAKVDFIAHSLGGLIGRYALEKLGLGAKKNLGTLITLGTPHEGIPRQVLQLNIKSFLPSEVYSLVDQHFDYIYKLFPAIQQLLPNSAFLNALNANVSAYRNNLKYYAVAGTDPTLYGLLQVKVTQNYFKAQGEECDGLVSCQSALSPHLKKMSHSFAENSTSQTKIPVCHVNLSCCGKEASRIPIYETLKRWLKN